MKIIHDLFHTGIPYVTVSVFFVVYSIKVYNLLKKIEKNTRMSELKKVNEEKYGKK
jgi:hypothetical protein